ncbi:Hypothetical protein, putative [Bodo saltans]|uniref:Uncharacterized protein n=1 Tax=Bodo saltans TaxID=75058 RepID=A0A0S4IYX2_BODSA|nr:Hypothetical protein, putative [Bodo saltans]|eukprot:CUG19222.1 Hypothetical protein, putative [Bodo saltans]
MQPSQPLPLSQIGKLKSAASSSNPQGGIPVTTSAPSSRPGTAEERRKELHKTLRDRHTPQHRSHFFGRPGSSGTTRPHQSGTSGGAESPDVGLEGPTWSNASLVNTQSLAARVEETDNVQLSPSQRHMSKQMRALADRTAKAEAEVATQEHMQQLFAGLPWWRRIVVDENFRRRVATLAARAIRAQEGYHRPDADAQNISLPPMFRWEAMSAENRVVQPTPGASCGPLDGVTHRWKGPFPPNGFVQLTPNVLNLRATAEKKGPLHINVYVPMRPKRQHHHASDQEDFDGTHALDELGGVRGDGMEHRTIGQMILDYEDAQRRKFELEMEAKRQQREAALNGGAGGSNGGMGGTRGKLAMDDEGFLTIDGVRLEQRYVGTLRPSFLLLRWRIICNAIHEYGASVSGLGVGRPGFVVAASPAALQASPILPSSAASMFGGSMPGSAPGTPRRTVKWNHSNNNNSSSPASVVHGVPDALELQQQQSIITSPTTPGASSTPSWLEGLPKFGVPVFAVEARPARNVYDQSTDKRRVEAYPPSKISGAFTSIRREDIPESQDIPESRRQFLFQAPGCRKAVHRLFQELHQDATGRIHQAAYVEFMLDLLHVFLPTFHAQSNIEVAEDEWLCRGVPEFPDFTIFYRNLFDFPLILCRERNTMTEEQYISVWDLLYEALYGREKLLGWYEVDIKRTQLLMGLPAPTTTTSYAAVRSSSPSAVLGGSSSVAANADALSWKAHLPSYLCPTSPESAIEVPLRKNADHYALHRVATHIESTHQQVQLSDPARRTFLIHRLASTHLANRTHQEGKSGDLSPAASFRLAAAASAGRRRNRKMEGGVDAEDNNDDDDDYLASPLLEGGGDAGVQFPSLALQVKQLADREKKAATSPGARGQRGKLHKTERQREEARRINEMLAIENKASSLNLYEEVYESPEMPRDDIDEILDYCSEISDTDLMDGSGEEEDLDEDEMIRSLDSAGGVPLGPHDAEVAAVAAAKAAAAARRKRSIRTLYHEDRLQRELRAEREAQEALEAKLLQQRRAALQQKQQRLSPPDLSLSGMSGRRRLSSISPTKPAALRRTSLVAQIAGNSKLGINTARSDDGQTQLSLSGRAPSPTSHKDSEIPVTSGGGIGPSGALSTNDAAAAHDPRPKMVLSPEHAQRVRRAERERVRQLALPNGNELVPTLSPSAPTPLVPPVAVPLQYRTFLASHLTGGARTALDASELQLIHTTPQQQKSSATRLPYGGGSQQHQRRPETAMSAHASLSVNPFQRLSRQTKSLIEATPQGGKSRQATTVDGGADWSSAEQADPQLVTEDPNSLGTPRRKVTTGNHS